MTREFKEILQNLLGKMNFIQLGKQLFKREREREILTMPDSIVIESFPVSVGFFSLLNDFHDLLKIVGEENLVCPKINQKLLKICNLLTYKAHKFVIIFRNRN